MAQVQKPNKNSPRSLEACKQEGILLSSLKYRPIESFAAPGKPFALQEMEYNQLEKKRQRKYCLVSEQAKNEIEILRQLREVRWAIIKAETAKSVTSAQATPFEGDFSIPGQSQTIYSATEREPLPQIQTYYDLLKRVWLFRLPCQGMKHQKIANGL